MSPADPDRARVLLDDLRAARPALLEVPVRTIASTLGAVGARFLEPGDPLREAALERIPEEAGLSHGMAVRILDGMARDWTEPRLVELLEREFGDPAVLDGFQPPEPGDSSSRLMAVGDEVGVHIGAGAVPGVCTTSMIRSLLVKTPVLIKPGAGDRALTEVFLEGLEHHAPALSRAAAVAYWPGGEWELEEAFLTGARRVVVYGSDRIARLVRDRVPVHVPLVVYHHRSSVAVVGPGAAQGERLAELAGDLAYAASTFDQRGCVSPHRVWVVGAAADAAAVAYSVGEAMAREAQAVPPGPRTPGEQGRVHQLRASVELREAAGEPVDVWADEGTAWTVVLESEAESEAAGTPRTLIVAAVPDVETLAAVLEGEGPHLQSVGLAGLGELEEAVATTMARLGATRLVPVRDMPFPPAWWHHDGAGPLRALVRWAEWTP